MNLAVHRSMIFWFGILAMTFICWAWRDSTRQLTAFYKGSLTLTSNGGELGIDYIENYLSREFCFYRGADGSDPIDQEILPSPRVLRRDSLPEVKGIELLGRCPLTREESLKAHLEIMGDNDWLLLTPYWLLLIIVGSVWVTLLSMRARRRKGKPSPWGSRISTSGAQLHVKMR